MEEELELSPLAVPVQRIRLDYYVMTSVLQELKDLALIVTQFVLQVGVIKDFSVDFLNMEEVQDILGKQKMALVARECIKDAKTTMETTIAKNMEQLFTLNAKMALIISDVVFVGPIHQNVQITTSTMELIFPVPKKSRLVNHLQLDAIVMKKKMVDSVIRPVRITTMELAQFVGGKIQVVGKLVEWDQLRVLLLALQLFLIKFQVLVKWL